MPTMLVLHGAGQSPREMIDRLLPYPGCDGVALVAPKSLGATWDVVWELQRESLSEPLRLGSSPRYSNSADGNRVMAAIAEFESRLGKAASRLSVLGFSDGAVFALALGTARDRRFDSVVALSPGLVVVSARPARRRPVLVMHGRGDRSLSFEFTRTTIVPALRDAGLAVTFQPFVGGHVLPPLPDKATSLLAKSEISNSLAKCFGASSG